MCLSSASPLAMRTSGNWMPWRRRPRRGCSMAAAISSAHSGQCAAITRTIMRNWFGNDWNWIVAGLVAAIVVPVLSFYAGMPIWIAAVIGLLVFVGLIF